MSEALQEVKPIWPVRVMSSIIGGIRSALGQLATREFWTKLSKIIVQEMISSFFKTLGVKFMTVGASREDPEIKRTAQTVTQTSANAAFSANSGSTYTRPESTYSRPDYSTGGYSRPDYRSYPVPVTTPAQDFPGFGGK